MDEFARSTLMELGVSLDKLTEDDKYCIESWQKFSSEEPDVNSEKFQKFKLSLLEQRRVLELKQQQGCRVPTLRPAIMSTVLPAQRATSAFSQRKAKIQGVMIEAVIVAANPFGLGIREEFTRTVTGRKDTRVGMAFCRNKILIAKS